MIALDNRRQRLSISLRAALTQVWDLNVRAIPTSLVWGISLMFIFESPNLALRLLSSVICSMTSLLNISILNNSRIKPKTLDLLRHRPFQKLLLLDILIGGLFVIALNNMLNLNPTSLWLSVAIKSSAPAFFILWMGLMLIFNPLYARHFATRTTSSIQQLFLLFIQKRKPEIFLTAFLLVILAPVIFVFLTIALTLTQSLTLITLDGLTFKANSKEMISYGSN